ncbi:PTS N-acetyl glucosamine transporter subunit IIABC [Sporolactobacillus shoreae]|uniref:PTS N-acetyl glucosamine transporter subunit IIABC n=1 Tax=Sporolactobacillus shoreae TaxID=1465501 RepID=A0A4Z0GSC1_9BACL|nr:PTS transporter subunit EIIC [Sporolactobacillus shoreae]TGA99806.1 PTS N-acetyl glucosamine transporter subunit IIABC [Sporolactobacillus shoreae]
MHQDHLFKRLAAGLVYPVLALIIYALFLLLSLTGFGGFSGVANTFGYFLPLILSVGLAVGIAHDKSGAAALAGCVGYLVFAASFTSIVNAKLAFDVTMPVKIGATLSGTMTFLFICACLTGIVAGWLYNKFYNIHLPDWLAFFGGRRFVPIITSVYGLFLGAFIAQIVLAHIK